LHQNHSLDPPKGVALRIRQPRQLLEYNLLAFRFASLGAKFRITIQSQFFRFRFPQVIFGNGDILLAYGSLRVSVMTSTGT
jgi:hypothetical protein